MLVLVRHGQTAANRGGLLQGRVDLPLTDLGHHQARAAAQYLADARVVRVVSSPLQRACATAQTIADGFGLDVEVDDRSSRGCVLLGPRRLDHGVTRRRGAGRRAH